MSATPWRPADERELARLVRGSGQAAAAGRLWGRYRAAVAHLAGPAGRRAPTVGLATVLAAFGRLYRPAGFAPGRLWPTLAWGIPRAVRAEGRWVALAAGLYVAAALLAGLITAYSPAWARWLLPAGLGQPGTHAGLAPAAALVPLLFLHNVSASAAAYAGGILAGAGTVVALLANGGLLGALAGWAAAHGQGVEFWSLIAPHGVLELPATFCAGGGGLAMGGAWLTPGERGRVAALLAAFRRTTPLFGACVAWLGGAALLEGLFTPQPIPAWWKLTAAAVLLLAFCAYLSLAGRGPAPTAPAPAPVPTDPPPIRLYPLLAPAAPSAGARAGRHPADRAVAFRLPEGLLIRLQPADVPTRALALLLDTGILAAAAACGFVGAAAAHLRVSQGWSLAYAAFFSLLFLGLYGFLFEWLGGGATPGKRALGLGVLRDDGRPAGVVPVLVRNLLRVVDFLPGLYFLGVASALASGGSRRVGDWAAGTVVVHLPAPARARRPDRHPPVPLPRPRTCGPLATPEALRRLPPRLRRQIARRWQRLPADGRLLQRAGVAGPEGLEHLAAALDRAGLLRGLRFGAAAPRDRTGDLEPRTPGRGVGDRLPDDLAAAVLAYWSRLPAIEGPHRARIAQRLAARLAEALGAPGLDRPDPDALVEHVAHLLQGGGAVPAVD